MNNGADHPKEEISKWKDDEVFRLMVQSVFDYSIFAIDLNGRIRNWNPGAERMFGYTKEEIIGKDMAILFPPEDQRQHAPELELDAAKRERSGGDHRWHMRKDGSRFWATGWVNPLNDDSGNLRGYVKVARDNTWGKRAEDALKESEAEFRAIFELAGTGKIETDLRTGRFLRVNQKFCDIVGYSIGELLTMTYIELCHSDDENKGLAALQHLASSKEEYVYDNQLRRKDGSFVWVHINIIALPNNEGNPTRTIGSVEEITLRKLAEAERERALESERMARSEAEDANRSKDDFIALVSHELRSPLNAILGWTRILRQGGHDEELCQSATEIIERSARMQSQLIEDLMDTVRIVTGKLKIEVQPVSLRPLIEKAMDVVRPTADAKGITLDARLDREADQITGDPNRLQQVVWNLLSNAVKFTDEGGRVEVTLGRVDSYVQKSIMLFGYWVSPIAFRY